MNAKVNIAGTKAVEAAIVRVEKKYVEFQAGVTSLRMAISNLGIEISQPTAGTDG